ncbi:MAG: hypothetical protein NZ899_15010 [Thermoguttaceae bacterium]|nr:hypothetical protein [Thermoguttaceae bacterium]
MAIVQTKIFPSVNESCAKMERAIAEAARGGARVVVFPEGCLWGADTTPEQFTLAKEKLARASAEANVYLIYGQCLPRKEMGRLVQAMSVVDPRGQEIFYYVKHYDQPGEKIPSVFIVDGVPASGIICADRWLRTIEELPLYRGAKISFELSANFAEEWIPPLQWCWYVPRALRNQVWVVFCNSAANVDCPGHGHSAVISPQGEIVAAMPDNREGILWAQIKPEQATAGGLELRANHPVLKHFWEAGLQLYDQKPDALGPRQIPQAGAPVDVTLVVAQVTGSLAEMEQVLTQAAQAGADLVAFPSGAAAIRFLPTLCELSRKYRTALALGIAQNPEDPQADISPEAIVIGPDGTILTRHHRLAQYDAWSSAKDLKSLTFRLNNVRGLILLEDDIRWTEVIEVAAVAGVQILIHVDHRQSTDTDRLQYLQERSVAASFGMFSAMANVVGSTLWEDLDPRPERRAIIDRRPWPDRPDVDIYSPFGANLIREAGAEEKLISAKRRIPGINQYFSDRIARFPDVAAWLTWAANWLF